MCYRFAAGKNRRGRFGAMKENTILVGLTPEVMAIGLDEQAAWISNAGSVKIQFDPNRCPFGSDVFQAPEGARLLTGPPRPGTKPGSYKYRVWLNDQLVGWGEVLVREK
jgi:hypothetical protein